MSSPDSVPPASVPPASVPPAVIMCVCGKAAELTCTNCSRQICSDIDCGTDTVDGYLCGTYTQWGCSRKYTNCDECTNDKAIHESDFIICCECSKALCEGCATNNFIPCETCGEAVCPECTEEHDCT